MFRGKYKKHDRPIGLDVRDHSLRLLQLGQSGGQLKALAAAQVDLPADLSPGSPAYHAALTDALRQALSKSSFSGQKVVSTMPHSAMLCRNFRLPPMPGDELRAAVQWEAQDRFRLGEGQASIQYLYAGEVSQGNEHRLELIVMASRLSHIEGHVASLTEAGLRPQAIDAPPTALAHLVTRLPLCADGDSSRVIIEVDDDVSRVLILRDQKVLFYKPIDVAGRQFDTLLAGGLKLPLTEARARRLTLQHAAASDAQSSIELLKPALAELGREIGLCLRYFGVTFRGVRPSRAELLGAAASPWLAEHLGGAAGVDLQLHDPLQGMDLEAVKETIATDETHGWAVAAGLSLRDAGVAGKRRAA